MHANLDAQVCWMFYNSIEQPPADTDGSHRIPGSRVLQHVAVPWTAPNPSECEFRILRSRPRDGVSVAKLARPRLWAPADWLTVAT